MPKNIHKQSRLCELCGCEYQPTAYHQRWCPDCRPEAHRKHLREYADRIRHDPIRGPIERRRLRRWQQENPERIRAFQDKCYRWPCPRCGKVRRVSRPGKEAKQELLCRRCRMNSRPKRIVYTRCYWCEDLVERQPYRIRKFAHQWHDKCNGAMKRAADTLGLTRERVRQLVKQEYADLNQKGQHGTRAEALALVVDRRKAKCIT